MPAHLLGGVAARCFITAALLLPGAAPAQVLVAPGESTETTFRRQIRGHWFAWLSAQEEGDLQRARGKIEDILKHAQQIEIRRVTDLALSATILGRRQLGAGRTEWAREAFTAAIRLDPELPEPRWARLSLLVKSHAWGAVPAEFLGVIRATVADGESRRIAGGRGVALALFTVLAVSLAIIVVLLVRHGRRYLHDLSEVAVRLTRGGGGGLIVAALFVAPLLLSLDIVWFALFLYVVLFGYASWPQKLAATFALALLVPLLPVLDRLAYDLAISSSPILRGAEALEESRYDQRVLDNLEAAKNSAPDDADIRFVLGRLYQALGQNDRAVAEYTAGAQISPRESRCLVNRGNIRFVDGDLGSAQQDYQEALRRDPRSIAARYNVALLYAETFRTVEASQMLQEARALDAGLVQTYQDTPTLVKVVSVGFTPAEARRKIRDMQGDPKNRRLLGQYRGWTPLAALAVPIVAGIPLAIFAAFFLDGARTKRYGYASECQKCARTFCRLCKPPGESDLLCSQCVHVYLKKDGVAIETKLQKLDDVRRRRALEDRLRVFVNLVLPGSAALLDSRASVALFSLTLFMLGVVALVAQPALAVVPRPSATPPELRLAAWGSVALIGWLLGQLTAKRS